MVQRGQGALAAKAADGKPDEDSFGQVGFAGANEFPVQAVGGLKAGNRAAVADEFHPVGRLEVGPGIVDHFFALATFATEDGAETAAE